MTSRLDLACFASSQLYRPDGGRAPAEIQTQIGCALSPRLAVAPGRLTEAPAKRAAKVKRAPEARLLRMGQASSAHASPSASKAATTVSRMCMDRR